MKSFEAHTVIAADAQTVWDTQLDVENWAVWDPDIVRVEGALAAGGSITLHTRRPGEDKIRPFKLKVVEWYPPSRLVLAGGMPLGMFTGTQIHESTRAREGLASPSESSSRGCSRPSSLAQSPISSPGSTRTQMA